MPTRVLIVDDSATMRAIMTRILKADPDIEVVGAVSDPHEAREAIKALEPDVLTLDIEMPRMDGLSFLEKIMRLRPMPVVMVSSLTQRGGDATVDALSLGAIDCVAKPVSGQSPFEAFGELPAKVKAAARARVSATPRTPRLPDPEQNYAPDGRVVCIGSSTGGVEALLTVLSTFPRNCPPTVVVQHMPESFTRSFAARLNSVCAPSVAEAHPGAPIVPGHVWIAPGAVSHLEIAGRDRLSCRLTEAPPVNGHRPSVDVLFRSAARLGDGAVGVILTGMGRDGADGLLAMRQAGAATIGQDEATSLIYGMPKAAHEIGAVSVQTPLQSIGAAILGRCRRPRRISPGPQPA